MSETGQAQHERLGWEACAAILVFMAIAAGAFGAHALRGQLPEKQLEAFKTAAQYQMFHGAAMLVLSARTRQRVPNWMLSILLGACFVFCGSLYLYSLTGQRHFAMATPVGGVLFLLFWLVLGIRFLLARYNSGKNRHFQGYA